MYASLGNDDVIRNDRGGIGCGTGAADIVEQCSRSGIGGNEWHPIAWKPAYACRSIKLPNSIRKYRLEHKTTALFPVGNGIGIAYWLSDQGTKFTFTPLYSWSD